MDAIVLNKGIVKDIFFSKYSNIKQRRPTRQNFEHFG